MDRKLTLGAIVLLLIQITLLFSDLNFLSHRSSDTIQNGNQKIGIVQSKSENLKKRNQGSVVWEDSYASDSLLSYDSILTLENSTAKLELKNDIHITLQENTLVVLEPPDSQTDDPLRIRFSYGDLFSSTTNDKLQIGSGDWRIEAQPGTDMNLKSLEDNKLEVEITKGELKLKNKTNPSQTQTISEGKRFTLSENSKSKELQFSETLKIEGDKFPVIYSHTFPVFYRIRWQGQPTAIRFVDTHKNVSYIELDQEGDSHNFQLHTGTYFVSIQDKQFISPEIGIRVLVAPIIRYTSPLARQRQEIGESILFSWIPIENIRQYKLELTNTLTEKEIIESNKSAITHTPQLSGELRMRVSAKDHQGYTIPPYYSQTLFIEDGLLAAPKLLGAATRSPSGNLERKQNLPKSLENKKIPPDDGRRKINDGRHKTNNSNPSKDPGTPKDHNTSKSKNGASLNIFRGFNFAVRLLLPSVSAAETNALSNRQSNTPENYSSTTATANTATTNTVSKPANNSTITPSPKSVNSPATKSAPKPANLPRVEFTWLPVDGADFYTIEISTEADFVKTEFTTRVINTNFVWASYEPGSYYWRVAGGTNTGRMGIFSDPAFVDLTNTGSNDPNLDIGSGAKIVPPKEVVILPSPSQSPNAQPPTQSAKTLSTNALSPKSAPELQNGQNLPLINGATKPQASSSRWEFWAQYHMAYSNYTYESVFKTNVSGFGVFSAAVGAEYYFEDNQVINTAIRYELLNWEASDANELPYQQKIDTKEFSIQSLYGQKWRDLQYGILIENINTPERSGLESIRVKSVNQFGLMLGYGLPIVPRLNFNASAGIVGGGGIFALRSFNGINYSYGQNYVGADFDFKIFFGPDSLSGFNFKSGVHFGRSW